MTPSIYKCIKDDGTATATTAAAPDPRGLQDSGAECVRLGERHKAQG